MNTAELVTIRRNLKDTFNCWLTIERAQSGGTNPYGEPDAPTWSTVARVACRFGMQTDAEQFAPAHDADTALYAALVPYGTDVTAADRVTDVTGPDGATLEAGPLAITSVVRQTTHVRLNLQKRQ